MPWNEKYKRHILLPEIGIEGQKKLQNASVLLVGVGGLGSAISLYLAAAGIGRLGIVDPDIVSLSNLQRQVLYTEAEIGSSKIECAKKRLQALNPNLQIDEYPFRFDKTNAEDIAKNYDLIVDGCDNFAARFLMNDTCLALNKPYVYGSIQEFHGQISVFNHNGNKTSYRDLYPDEKALIEKASVEKGVLGAVPGIIGCMQVSEVVKIITGAGNVLSGKLLTIDMLTMQTQVWEI